MSITFTAEQDELRKAVRRFLAERSGSREVRRLIDDEAGSDPAVWATLVHQLGLPGLAIAEEFGGAGYGAIELGIVLEEMGRVLFSGPYFATVALAGQALTACGTAEARARWLPRIAGGAGTATVAIAEESGRWTLSDIDTRAVQDAGGWRLTGTKMFVMDGTTADVILVFARYDDEVGLYAVQSGAGGLSASRLDVLDPTRRLARLELLDVGAERVDAGQNVQRALDLALIAAAAEQLGGAQHCLDESVEYAKIRVQFGRPIGSFQAIKHKAADMLLRIEAARSGVYHAMSVAASGPPSDLTAAAALAKTWASDAFAEVAKEAIQIHGGIGFTWEHDAHLYLRRAKSGQLLFGSPDELRAGFADLVGI